MSWLRKHVPNALLAMVMVSSATALSAAPRQNFVIIMADDLGYADLSCYGNDRYQTPHIDQLATEGLRFTDYHSNGPVCSPTRAALLTGRYQQRAGIEQVINADPKVNRDTGLKQSELTFADVLHDAGYATAIIGKWHLGYDVKFNPVHQGFDLFRGYVSGNICYISHLDRMGIEDWWLNDKLSPEPGYSTHLITRHAVEFIEQHKDRPFCLYVAHESVHSPFQGPNDPAVRTRGKVGEIKANARQDIPGAYAEMVTEMDKGVGEILAVLKANQLAENTLVIFCSDNGATREGNNGHLKGFKGSLWEGGHRVPCIAWQPGKVPAGITTSVTALSMDWMPTMLDLAEVPLAYDMHLDGISLANVLRGESGPAPRKLFWQYGAGWACRDGDWKLISPGRNESVQLYHLKNDPAETTDLAQQEPRRVQRMTEDHLTWRASLAAEVKQGDLAPDLSND